MSENEDPIRRHSENLLRLIKENTGAELEYTLLSLLHLDKVLEHLFGKGLSHIPPENADEMKKVLRVQIACYYGECIRETFSGVWTQDENMGLSLKDIANMDIAILPLNTAHERLEGDDTKIFAATRGVCAEVFKQMQQKFYTDEDQPTPAVVTPPPLPPQ